MLDHAGGHDLLPRQHGRGAVDVDGQVLGRVARVGADDQRVGLDHVAVVGAGVAGLGVVPPQVVVAGQASAHEVGIPDVGVLALGAVRVLDEVAVVAEPVAVLAGQVVLGVRAWASVFEPGAVALEHAGGLRAEDADVVVGVGVDRVVGHRRHLAAVDEGLEALLVDHGVGRQGDDDGLHVLEGVGHAGHGGAGELVLGAATRGVGRGDVFPDLDEVAVALHLGTGEEVDGDGIGARGGDGPGLRRAGGIALGLAPGGALDDGAVAKRGERAQVKARHLVVLVEHVGEVATVAHVPVVDVDGLEVAALVQHVGEVGAGRGVKARAVEVPQLRVLVDEHHVLPVERRVVVLAQKVEAEVHGVVARGARGEAEVLGLPVALVGREVGVVEASVVVNALAEAEADVAATREATARRRDLVVVHELVGLAGLEVVAPFVDAGGVTVVVVGHSHVGAVGARAVVGVAGDVLAEAPGLGLLGGEEVVGEPVLHVERLEATEGADLLEVARCPRGPHLEAGRGLVGGRRAHAHVERVLVQRGGGRQLDVLVGHDPRGLGVVVEGSAGAGHEGPGDRAQATARGRRGARGVHVAAGGVGEQVGRRVEPQGVCGGVLVVVGELARGPQAVGARDVAAHEVDLVAGHDLRDRRGAGQKVGHGGPDAVAEAGAVLDVVALAADHVPGGDVDLLELGVPAEGAGEEARAVDPQATTVEVLDAREAREPGGKVARTQAVAAVAHDAVVARRSEVGDDVLDLSDGHRLGARSGQPRQGVAVLGHDVVGARGVIVQAHGHGLGLVVVAPPGVAVAGELAAVDPAVGVDARGVAARGAVVGVGQLGGVAVAVGLARAVLVPVARHVGADGRDLGEAGALEHHARADVDDGDVLHAGEHVGDARVGAGGVAAHLPVAHVELLEHGATLEHRVEVHALVGVPVAGAGHGRELGGVVEGLVEARDVARVQVGAVEAREGGRRGSEPLAHRGGGHVAVGAVGGKADDVVPEADAAERLLPRQVGAEHGRGMALGVADEADAQEVGLVLDARVGNRRGVLLGHGPPDVAVVGHDATQVGGVEGVGRDVAGHVDARVVPDHEVIGVAHRGGLAQGVGVLDPHAVGKGQKRGVGKARVVGGILVEQRVGAEGERHEVGVLGVLGVRVGVARQLQHVGEQDVAVAVGVGAHVPLRQVDAGDGHLIRRVGDVVEHVREVRHLVDVPVIGADVGRRAGDGLDGRELGATREQVGELERRGGARAGGGPVAQAVDVGELAHGLEGVAQVLDAGGTPARERVEVGDAVGVVEQVAHVADVAHVPVCELVEVRVDEAVVVVEHAGHVLDLAGLGSPGVHARDVREALVAMEELPEARDVADIPAVQTGHGVELGLVLEHAGKRRHGIGDVHARAVEAHVVDVILEPLGRIGRGDVVLGLDVPHLVAGDDRVDLGGRGVVEPRQGVGGLGDDAVAGRLVGAQQQRALAHGLAIVGGVLDEEHPPVVDVGAEAAAQTRVIPDVVEVGRHEDGVAHARGAVLVHVHEGVGGAEPVDDRAGARVAHPHAGLGGAGRDVGQAGEHELGELAQAQVAALAGVTDDLVVLEQAVDGGVAHVPAGEVGAVHGDVAAKGVAEVGVVDGPVLQRHGAQQLGVAVEHVAHVDGSVLGGVDLPVRQTRDVGERRHAVEGVGEVLDVGHVKAVGPGGGEHVEVGQGGAGEEAAHVGDVGGVPAVGAGHEVGELDVAGEHVGEVRGLRGVHARAVEVREVDVAPEPVGREAHVDATLGGDLGDARAGDGGVVLAHVVHGVGLGHGEGPEQPRQVGGRQLVGVVLALGHEAAVGLGLLVHAAAVVGRVGAGIQPQHQVATLDGVLVAVEHGVAVLVQLDALVVDPPGVRVGLEALADHVVAPDVGQRVARNARDDGVTLGQATRGAKPQRGSLGEEIRRVGGTRQVNAVGLDELPHATGLGVCWAAIGEAVVERGVGEHGGLAHGELA